MPDFPLQPDFPVEESLVQNTLISAYENGIEQRRSRFGTPLREFTLSFKNRGISEFCCLRDFFNAQQGMLCTFNFQNINDGCCYNVRFKEDRLSLQLISYHVYSMEAALVQVK